MRKNIKILSFVVMVGLAGLVLYYRNSDLLRELRLYVRVLILKMPNPLIAEGTLISTDWVEIVPPTPLDSTWWTHDVTLHSQEIDFSSEGVNTDSRSGFFMFKNRKIGRVELMVYDDLGQEHEMIWCALGGGSISFCKKTPPRQVDETHVRVPAFDFDRTITKIRVRSEVPFTAEKIEWRSPFTF